MRLWHTSLISRLPRQQLLGQHRECCALRGLGWGRKHSIVDYVFKHPYWWLFLYHMKVIDEMNRMGYKINLNWILPSWRGNNLKWDFSDFTKSPLQSLEYPNIYPEHDDSYLVECIENLKRKGIQIQ